MAVSRGLSGPQYVKKAATLTTIVHGSSSHDSIQPSAALSCLNVNKCDANNLIDNTQIPYDKGKPLCAQCHQSSFFHCKSEWRVIRLDDPLHHASTLRLTLIDSPVWLSHPIHKWFITNRNRSDVNEQMIDHSKQVLFHIFSRLVWKKYPLHPAHVAAFSVSLHGSLWVVFGEAYLSPNWVVQWITLGVKSLIVCWTLKKGILSNLIIWSDVLWIYSAKATEYFRSTREGTLRQCGLDYWIISYYQLAWDIFEVWFFTRIVCTN